jgi:hypothetical protein
VTVTASDGWVFRTTVYVSPPSVGSSDVIAPGSSTTVDPPVWVIVIPGLWAAAVTVTVTVTGSLATSPSET